MAGMQLRYFGYAFAASLLPLYFLLFHVSWRRDRMFAFWNPYADPRAPLHIIQSLIAVSTGGLTGLGPWKASRSSSTFGAAPTSSLR
jgi:cell division protein FtsW